MSHVNDIRDALEMRFADGTVSFEAGENSTARHGQRRRIIFIRRNGVLRPSSAPGKNVATIGAPGTFERMVFQREERIEIVLRAESDDALDIMFDRLAKCIFNEFGPNALRNENPYEWYGGDSSAGGSNIARQPAISFDLWVKLRSRDAFPLPLVEIDHTQATLTELGQSVIVTRP